MFKALLFILLLFSTVQIYSQSVDPRHFDYRKADSIALHLPKAKYISPSELAYAVTAQLYTDQEKFRAIFRWITDNIQYSYSNKTSDASKVLKRRKAVCAGYSSLLQSMCDAINIECETVIGYAKTTVNDIPMSYKKIDHAWNAIKLDNVWYLVDVTWATSYQDLRNRKMVKCFDETYFLCDPTFFAMKHLPKDKKWQLNTTTISKAEFSKSPIFYDGYQEFSLNHLDPVKGTIKARINKPVQISFSTPDSVHSVLWELNPSKKTITPQYSFANGCCTMWSEFDKPGVYSLTIFVNHKAVVDYKLQIRK